MGAQVGRVGQVAEEQRAVDAMYARLDAEVSAKVVAQERVMAAPVGAPSGLLHRDLEVSRLAESIHRLRAAEQSLCFGRIDVARLGAGPREGWSSADLALLDEASALVDGLPETIHGHVVVDEAQLLSEMQWRALARRCPGRSMTIVGDLAQAGPTTTSAPGSPSSTRVHADAGTPDHPPLLELRAHPRPGRGPPDGGVPRRGPAHRRDRADRRPDVHARAGGRGAPAPSSRATRSARSS